MSTQARTPDGNRAIADAVQLFESITDADSPYDLDVNTYLLVDSSGGAVTVNLPSARNGDILTISHPSGGTFAVTVNPAAGELIDGAASDTLGADGITSYRATRTAAGAFGWGSI